MFHALLSHKAIDFLLMHVRVEVDTQPLLDEHGLPGGTVLDLSTPSPVGTKPAEETPEKAKGPHQLLLLYDTSVVQPMEYLWIHARIQTYNYGLTVIQC